MAVSDPLAGDLAYVADAVRRRDTGMTPWPIPVFWAVVTAGGFTLVDVRPKWCMAWFVTSAVLGAVLTGVMARRGRDTGDYDRIRGWRVGLHWSSIFLAVVVSTVIALTAPGIPEVARWKLTPQLNVLCVGIVYLLGGVHLERRYLPLGAILMAGSIVVGLVDKWAWTTLGVVVGLGLVALAFVPRKVRQ